ncbi:MAG: cysteine--tRNA ligase [Gemmatimonadaceae bacterium]
MRLYNTLSRQVEDFAPSDGRTVRMYTCGPTVYNPAHLGNFRTFLFEDLMRRTLRLRGWEVRQVMNLTDVDDKIIKRAKEQGKTITEVTAHVVDVFHADREFLRIEQAEEYPRATEYVAQMIELVGRLMDRGVAYQAEDGSIYFAIGRFPGYGRLSRLDTREIKSGARVAQDEYSKENAQDFALWKAATPEDEAAGAAWDSPWGRGRPGWHLECSAMAMSLLGETIDVHCGAVDLIFPHHEDEIAQSEAATGKPFSRFWCHGGFLLTEGAKMAKRVGNVWTVLDVRRAGIPPAAIRYFVFSTHYRKELNLVPEAVEGAVEAVRRIGNFALRLRAASGGTPALAEAAERAERAVREALFDDLNAPEALAALMTFVSEANAELDKGGSDAGALERARAAFATIDGVLDVTPAVRSETVRVDGGQPREVESLLAAAPEDVSSADYGRWVGDMLGSRQLWRQARQFAKADAIRAALVERGVQVEDTPQGARWTLMG